MKFFVRTSQNRGDQTLSSKEARTFIRLLGPKAGWHMHLDAQPTGAITARQAVSRVPA